MNDGGVCRTAPATPALLIIYVASTMIFYNCLIFIYIKNEIKHDPAKYISPICRDLNEMLNDPAFHLLRSCADKQTNIAT